MMPQTERDLILSLLMTVQEDATFIADSMNRAEYNGATLYYLIFDGTYWSTPKAVADDGTPDSIHT